MLQKKRPADGTTGQGRKKAKKQLLRRRRRKEAGDSSCSRQLLYAKWFRYFVIHCLVPAGKKEEERDVKFMFCL